VALKGWLVKPAHPGTRSPAIIICHGVGANRSDFTELAASFPKRGYFILQFDFRAHGESAGSRTSLGYHEQKDIIAALHYLKKPSRDRFRTHRDLWFLHGRLIRNPCRPRRPGHSPPLLRTAPSRVCVTRRGRRSRILSSARIPFSSSHRSWLRTLLPDPGGRCCSRQGDRCYCPDTGSDHRWRRGCAYTADNGRRLYAAAKEPKELWVIAGADHGGTLAAAGDEYEKRVGEFFDKYLK